MDDAIVRERLAALVLGEGAHVSLERALEGLPEPMRGQRPPGLEHSPWELLEHLRLAQQDLLRYSLDPDWRSPKWPEGYWPDTPEPPSPEAWEASLEALRRDRREALALVRDRQRDLTAPLPHAPQHNLLRQLMLLGDHDAYHVGQIVDVRRALGAWPPG